MWCFCHKILNKKLDLMTDIKSSLPEWCDDHWPATTYHHLTTTTSLLHSAASLVLQPTRDHQTGGWLAVGAQLLQFSRRIDWCLIQCQSSNNWERERESESQNVLNSRDTNRSTFIQQDTAASVSQTVYFFKYVLSIVDPVQLPTMIPYSPIAWNEINVECIDVEWRAFPVLVIVTIVM